VLLKTFCVFVDLTNEITNTKG